MSNTIDKLNSNWCCFKVLPLVYDDSLSYYEVLCKLTSKMNEIIETFNTLNIAEIVDELIKEKILNGEAAEWFIDVLKQYGVCYEMFDVDPNNSYAGIKRTHDFANANNIPVILQPYKKYTINEAPETISILTDVDFNNSTITIDDTSLAKEQTIIDVFTVGTDVKYYTKFTLPDSNNYTENNYNYNYVGGCAYIRLEGDYKVWKRKDGGTGELVTECNVINDGTVVYNPFFTINEGSYVYRDIFTTTCELKNLRLIKKCNNEVQPENVYYLRGFRISRDNTTIKNWCIDIVNNTDNCAPYTGFLSVRDCYNVTVENVFYKNSFKRSSSYLFLIQYGMHVTFRNVTSASIFDSDFWGDMTSNYSRDLTFENCNMNRIDAHRGVYGLNVNDCHIGYRGINISGGQYCNINNTSVGICKYFVSTRADYGGGFNGIIAINNCKHWNFSYEGCVAIYTDFNFNSGYEWKIPKVIINNLTARSNNSYSLISNVINNNTGQYKLKLYDKNAVEINNVDILAKEVFASFSIYGLYDTDESVVIVKNVNAPVKTFNSVGGTRKTSILIGENVDVIIEKGTGESNFRIKNSKIALSGTTSNYSTYENCAFSKLEGVALTRGYFTMCDFNNLIQKTAVQDRYTLCWNFAS